MSMMNKGRRLPSSCDNCRRRKIKCDKTTSYPCRRCNHLHLECNVTANPVAKPYYHTSKERFELMATIVRHVLPKNSTLSVEDLRDFVFTLSDGSSNIVQGGSTEDYIKTTSQFSSPENPTELIGNPPQALSPEWLNGAYLPDATNSRRFDGAASYRVFQSRVASLISDKFSRLALLQQEPIDLRDGEPISSVAPTELPDRRKCEQCITQFFREINSVVYILSREKLFNDVEQVYQTGTKCTPSMKTMIHLVVAIMTNSKEQFEFARAQMDNVIEEGSIESIQVIILMALYRQRQNQCHFSWVILGNAVRIAQSLGLHVCTEDESPYWIERKTKLWWSIYELDQWFSCTLGRPAGTNLDLKDVSLLSDDTIMCSQSPPAYAYSSVKLAQILARVMNCIFLKDPEKGCFQQDINCLIQVLQSWWAELPQHLKQPQSGIPQSFVRAIFHLRLRYCHILVLITRFYLFDATFIHKETSCTDHPMITLCEKNNDECIQTLIEMSERKLLSESFWLDTHHILCTGLILLLRVLRNPTDMTLRCKVEDFQHVLKTCSSCKIGRYATLCFEAVLQDIDNTQQRERLTQVTSEATEFSFQKVASCGFDFDLLGQPSFLEFDWTDLNSNLL